MVTLTPTSITNKDTATPSQAMVTTPCTTMLHPTMALVSLLLVPWVIMALTSYQLDMVQAMELLSPLWGVDLDMAMVMGTDTATSATTRSRERM